MIQCLSLIEITEFWLESKSCKGFFFCQIRFPPMRDLEFLTGRVTFKLHYNQILKSSNWKTPTVKNLRSELSQIQTHHVEAVNELEKTRSLLRVQATINQEQKMEAETLQQRLFQIKAEFQSQIGEYKKLLDMRAARIHKCKGKIVWKKSPRIYKKEIKRECQKALVKPITWMGYRQCLTFSFGQY